MSTGPGPTWAQLGYRVCAVYEGKRRTKDWCVKLHGWTIRDLGTFTDRRFAQQAVERHHRQHSCKHGHVGTIKGGDGSTWCGDCRKRMD